MSSPKVIFGFHAVGVRLKTAPKSVIEVLFDASRRDARMQQFKARAQDAGVRLVEADGLRLSKLSGSHGHQGVAARVEHIPQTHSIDELLEGLEAAGTMPLLLVLDGVTDPHNLGACLRVADGAGAHAVIAPKDHAAGINATVAKVASGAAEQRRRLKLCGQGIGHEAFATQQSLHAIVMKHHRHAVAGQLDVALDGEAAIYGGLECAGAIFDDAVGAVMQTPMSDRAGKHSLRHGRASSSSDRLSGIIR